MIGTVMQPDGEGRTSVGQAVGVALDQFLKLAPELLAFADKLKSIERLEAEQVVEAEQIRFALQQQTEAIESLCSRQDLLEEASRTQAKLTDQHYRDHVINPVARQLIPIVDMLEDEIKRAKARGERGPVTKLGAGICKILVDTLAQLGVDLFRSPPGTSFDPKCMRVMRITDTSDETADRTVAEDLRAGFLLRGDVLRPAKITLYRHRSVHLKQCEVEGEARWRP